MSWVIKGQVSGHYACGLELRVHRYDDGVLVAKAAQGEATYAIPVPEHALYYLALLPAMGNVWQRGRFHGVGDLIIPARYPTVPYYFKCAGAGITGLDEPDFTATPLLTVVDNTCLWERVERIPYPLIHYPVLPVWE